MGAIYRCGLSPFVRPSTVYACNEFEAKVHVTCYLESGEGSWYVDLANAPVEWYIDGRYVGTSMTDSLGWSYMRLHIAVPGRHIVKVVFRGLVVGDTEYRGDEAEYEIPVNLSPQVYSTLMLTCTSVAVLVVFAYFVLIAKITAKISQIS